MPPRMGSWQPGEATLPVERVPRPPVRQLVLVGDVLAEQKAVLGGLPQGGEIPIALELVRWLMVMLAVVLLVGLRAEAGRLAEELGGVADAESRNPGVGQREMVRAEVVPGFGAQAHQEYNSKHYHQPSDEFQ